MRLTLPKGRCHLNEQLPRIIEDAELNLSDSFRVLLAQLKLELEQLAARIEEIDRVIQKSARENEACQRLTEIPGVGPITATHIQRTYHYHRLFTELVDKPVRLSLCLVAPVPRYPSIKGETPMTRGMSENSYQKGGDSYRFCPRGYPKALCKAAGQ